MRSCLVLSGGRLDAGFVRSYLKTHSFDRTVAADSGLVAARELGIIPDYVVGDFDSTPAEVLGEFGRYPHIVWETHRPEKDETDTELALNRARTLGCGRIEILGGTGGRFDHMLANLDALKSCLECGIEAYLIDPQNRICLIDGRKTFSRRTAWGKYISFIPYTDVVTGITHRGFKYTQKDRTLHKGLETGLFISNELAQEEGEITLSEGVLICVESRDLP